MRDRPALTGETLRAGSWQWLTRLRPAPVAICLAPLALALLAGCDSRPPRVPVSGQVLIDGEPLPYGQLMVMPADGRAAYGKIGPDGRFTLTCYDEGDGCLPGKHPAIVVACEALSGSTQKWHAPKRYADPEKSDLTVTIDEPTDDLTIRLTWEGGAPFIERMGDEGAPAEQ